MSVPVNLPDNDVVMQQQETEGQIAQDAAESKAAKPMSNATLMISVDTSTSTRGKVLEQEKAVIANFGAQLTSSAYLNSFIGPWNGSAAPLLGLNDFGSLSCETGTNPCVILQNADHVQAAIATDVWLLLTDGEINESDVSCFANRIPQHRLHGKPCIIVVFGSRPHRPLHANISVGVSLYSATADCIFLFHDVQNNECFVFQSKGCFDVLNPKKALGQELTPTTAWTDLSQLDYKDFKNLGIPKRRPLERNEVLLQRGKYIDFDRLLSGQISAGNTNAILDDQDNLNTIILTASTRGKHKQIQDWIKQQKIQRAVMTGSRDDGASAQSLMAQILDLFEIPSLDTKKLQAVQADLISAHQKNWDHVFRSLSARSYDHDERMQVIDDAIDRMNSIRTSGTSSPRVLSQVSSPYVRNSRQSSSSWQHVLPVAHTPSRSSGSWEVVGTPESGSLRNRIGGFGLTANDRMAFYIASQMGSQLTFLPGYRLTSNSKSCFPNTCAICGRMAKRPAVLLKSNSNHLITNLLSLSHNQADLPRYLNMAFDADIDVFSLTGSCDSCAFHLVQSKLMHQGERFTGAIPVGIDVTDNATMETWLETVDQALGESLHKATLPMFMLAVATRKLNELGSNIPLLSNFGTRAVLTQFCDDLLPRCDVLLSTAHQLSVTDAMNATATDLSAWLSQPGTPLERTSCLQDLLQHSIESFLLLLQYAKHLDPLSQTRYVFVKLTLHMIERHQVRKDSHKQRALFSDTTPASHDQVQSANIHLPSYDLQDLVDADVIDKTIYELLRVSGESWNIIAQYCMPAINCIVFQLVSGGHAHHSDVLDIFSGWVTRDSFRMLCFTPWDPEVVSDWRSRESLLRHAALALR